jgi:hypothetical protein
VPLELVVVKRLSDPEYAAAVVATGVLALKNEPQPSAVPSSKLYVATVCARKLLAEARKKARIAMIAMTIRFEGAAFLWR